VKYHIIISGIILNVTIGYGQTSHNQYVGYLDNDKILDTMYVISVQTNTTSGIVTNAKTETSVRIKYSKGGREKTFSDTVIISNPPLTGNFSCRIDYKST
jgi:hypothetical protein